ncbi:hypothetical protein ACKKBG_A23155 [Auxenochlorella protothecoides x Auxenochlorella symbiontica]
MLPQVLLVAGREEGPITVWDVDTGAALTSYKSSACTVNGLALVGRDHFVACQSSKGAVHAWTWSNDQVSVRSHAPEPLRCLAASPCGTFVAGSAASGAVHLWSTGSGRLLRSWPAHYKAVAALCWSADAALLCSAGGDGVVSAWLVAAAADPAAAPGAAPEPWQSWASHTLGVTALALDACDAILVSVGLDRALVVASLVGDRPVLARHALPSPLHSLALDPGGHAAYAGAVNGAVYEVSLAGGAQGAEFPVLEGHSLPVVALAFAGPDAGTLISGSEDGGVRFWDLRTRQQTRVLETPAKGPVAALVTLDRPRAMQVLGSRGRQQQGVKKETGTQPLGALAKFPGAPGTLRPWEDALVLLDGSGVEAFDEAAAGCAQESGDSLVPGGAANRVGAVRESDAAPLADGAAAPAAEDNESGALVALREENAGLKLQLARAAAALEQMVAMQGAPAERPRSKG